MTGGEAHRIRAVSSAAHSTVRTRKGPQFRKISQHPRENRKAIPLIVIARVTSPPSKPIPNTCATNSNIDSQAWESIFEKISTKPMLRIGPLTKAITILKIAGFLLRSKRILLLRCACLNCRSFDSAVGSRANQAASLRMTRERGVCSARLKPCPPQMFFSLPNGSERGTTRIRIESTIYV